jgi:O-antigen ligase
MSSDEGGIGRIKELSSFGMWVIPVLCSYYPTASLFNPRRGRFYAMMLGLVSILVSGFRNSLLWAGAAVAIGGILYRRWRDLAVGAVVGTLLLGTLIMGQGHLYNLPSAVQRTLCFLPGQWSPEVVVEAQASSEWRFNLWKEIIERHSIKDWWFGDGFGAKAKDVIALGSRSSTSLTDFVLETGAYHNGPLTTIRYVGIIGLVLLYALSIAAAVYAYKMVQRCRGTILFPVSALIAIQLIATPIHFTFLYGDYDSYLTNMLIQLGVLRVLMRFCDQGLIRPTPKQTAPPTVVPARMRMRTLA